MAEQRRFLVGVCGGIAAYKALTLVRLLKKAGAQVHVVPTPAALQFIGAATFRALAEHPIATDIFSADAGVEHVELARWASDIVIAPATANTLAKLAGGFADNLLTATVLASDAKLWLAPAMHTQMWENPATQENLARLQQRGAQVIAPVAGDLSSGDSGVGRLPDPEQIFAQLMNGKPETAWDASALSALSGKRMVVTAGGTHEPIDPVRFIGNRSSGKQGCEIARAAHALGVDVELIAANVASTLLPPGVHVTRVETAAELGEAVRAAAENADIVVMAAAVADFTVVDVAQEKLGKTDTTGREQPLPELKLAPTEDILARLNRERSHPRQIIVGFSAETGALDKAIVRARHKAARKGSDLTVFNLVGNGLVFGQSVTSISVIDHDGAIVASCRGSKADAAMCLLEQIAARVAVHTEP